MTCGIYQFWCGPYFYVGRSVNIERRRKVHLRGLKNGTHSNPKAQHAFNKYGWTGQDVLVECEPHQNEKNEQHFIDLYRDAEFCLNLSPRAEGGGPAEHTQETKAKMRSARHRHYAKPGSREVTAVGMVAALANPATRQNYSIAAKRTWRERKIRNFEAELADIPEGGDIISMFEVKHEEP